MVVLDKVAVWVKKATLQVNKIFNPILQPYDLTEAQYKVLKYLYALPSHTARQVDIEVYYSLTHPTMIGLLQSLEKKGFVSRVKNPEDGRSRLVSLTSKTIEMQDELVALGARLEARLTEKLSQKEREELIRLLQKLLDTSE